METSEEEKHGGYNSPVSYIDLSPKGGEKFSRKLQIK